MILVGASLFDGHNLPGRKSTNANRTWITSADAQTVLVFSHYVLDGN